MNRLFTHIVRAWFTLGRILNTVSTTVLLTLIYFLIVVPVGLIRRLDGADPLRLRQFKKSRGSVLHTRDHTFSKNDLQNLF